MAAATPPGKSAGRSLDGNFQIGQEIRVSHAEGRIVALGTAAVLLEPTDGNTLRVPNHLLLETIVTIARRAAAD